MTNHIHLIMQCGDVPLSRFMQNLSLRYTKWINTTQAHTGHLFQGRYKALLLDADSYLIELIRYLHLNPVRAGMAASPDEYQWSGHNAYLGKELLPRLSTEWVLSLFSAKEPKARQGITEDQLKSPGKARSYAEARAAAALLVQETPGVSLTDLGKMVNRDIAPLGRAGRRLREDEGRHTLIDELRKELRN